MYTDVAMETSMVEQCEGVAVPRQDFLIENCND